jgi:hypothetical protein
MIDRSPFPMDLGAHFGWHTATVAERYASWLGDAG